MNATFVVGYDCMEREQQQWLQSVIMLFSYIGPERGQYHL